jgi:hypothetical protein
MELKISTKLSINKKVIVCRIFNFEIPSTRQRSNLVPDNCYIANVQCFNFN